MVHRSEGRTAWRGYSAWCRSMDGTVAAAVSLHRRLRHSAAFRRLVRSDGMYHGAVVWGVTWLVFAWLTTTAMSFMLGGVFSALGSAIQTTGQGITNAASAALNKMDPKSNFNISPNELRRQIESTLQATGKRELQPAAINKSADRLANRARKRVNQLGK